MTTRIARGRAELFDRSFRSGRISTYLWGSALFLVSLALGVIVVIAG
ncbi:MAG: hypothetical protein KJ042_07255 [Deltaproteobacteria bacterium]|nr:hypothetical protein [Deltaproteobacteria bacterium]